jgi:hypothetical protein
MEPPPKQTGDAPTSSAEDSVDEHTKVGQSGTTTKKFHLSESMKRELVEYAELHYRGNASHFLRAAIKDHISTLDGENEYEVEKLRYRMEQIEEELTELTEQISEAARFQRSFAQQRVESKEDPQKQPGDHGQASVNSQDNGLQTTIYTEISDADSSRLTVEELLERTDSDLLALSATLDTLVSKDILTLVTDTEQPTYEIKSSSEHNE